MDKDQYNGNQKIKLGGNMNKRIIFKRILPAAILSLILFLNSCNNNPVDANGKNNLDIYETVFRDMFRYNGSGFVNYYTGAIDTSIKAYYLEFYAVFDSNYFHHGNPSDPSQELLNRFSGYEIPVKRGSESSKNNGSYVTDIITGQYGLSFYAGPIEKLSDTKVQLLAGYYWNGGNSDCHTFILEFINGQWQITNKILRWVS
jgi:hypothetical protein